MYLYTYFKISFSVRNRRMEAVCTICLSLPCLLLRKTQTTLYLLGKVDTAESLGSMSLLHTVLSNEIAHGHEIEQNSFGTGSASQ